MFKTQVSILGKTTKMKKKQQQQTNIVCDIMSIQDEGAIVL